MSENMEEITFIKNTIFDRKVRKPGATVTVSQGEAENLRRIGVVAEKGDEDVDALDNVKNEAAEEDAADNADVADETGPEPGPEPENKMPPALPVVSFETMSKRELKAELDKRGVSLNGRENKTKMLSLIMEHEECSGK